MDYLTTKRGKLGRGEGWTVGEMFERLHLVPHAKPIIIISTFKTRPNLKTQNMESNSVADI